MNIKILLVEDDPINRDVINWYLRNLFDVSVAENGSEALKLAASNQFDLILMDINLGKGINGIETAKLIKEDDRYKDVPVVALTAYAMKGDKEHFLSSGFTDYLSKPFLKEELIYLIGTLFNEEKYS
ncbi:MAG: response regulator [Ignavibacteriaceae bacterium]